MEVYQGKRGKVYRFFNLAIKVKRKESKAIGRIKNEAKFLKILNKYSIGPKIYSSGKNWVIYKFVKGKTIKEYFKNAPLKEKIRVIKEVLLQCRTLDKLHINKFEMNHPQKHIIIGKKIKMIDFERCTKTTKSKNITQFLQFISSLNLNLSKKKIIKLSKKYKHKQTDKNFKEILNLFN